MSSINAASNHQPVLIGVAQHGSLDDAIYFTVSDNTADVGNKADEAGGSAAGVTSAEETATASSDANLAPAETAQGFRPDFGNDDNEEDADANDDGGDDADVDDGNELDTDATSTEDAGEAEESDSVESSESDTSDDAPASTSTRRFFRNRPTTTRRFRNSSNRRRHGG